MTSAPPRPAGPLPVLTAVDDPGLEASLVDAIGQGRHGLVVVRRCVDLADLMAAASIGTTRVAILSPGLRGLDLQATSRLREAGVAVVALVPATGSRPGAPGAEESAALLRRIGVRDVVAVDVADPSAGRSWAGQVAQVAQAAAASLIRDAPDATATTPSALPAVPPSVAVDATAGRHRQGRLVAVWGPTGAPGRSTVSWNLTGEWCRAGSEVLVLDADVYGGSIAALAGLVDEAPGVVAACRAANAGALDAARLAGACRTVLGASRSARVLTGIPRAARWPEVQPDALEAVLGLARELADMVVVDCGFSLEDDAELSYDTLAPRRNAATRRVLSLADEIVVVGSADPVGLVRLVNSLGELREVLDEIGAQVEPRVVVNRVRLERRQSRREIVEALERHAGVTPVVLLAHDPDACDRSVVDGRWLAETSPRSVLRLGLQALAEAICPSAGLAAAPRAASRRLRRTRSVA